MRHAQCSTRSQTSIKWGKSGKHTLPRWYEEWRSSIGYFQVSTISTIECKYFNGGSLEGLLRKLSDITNRHNVPQETPIPIFSHRVHSWDEKATKIAPKTVPFTKPIQGLLEHRRKCLSQRATVSKSEIMKRSKVCFKMHHLEVPWRPSILIAQTKNFLFEIRCHFQQVTNAIFKWAAKQEPLLQMGITQSFARLFAG